MYITELEHLSTINHQDFAFGGQFIPSLSHYLDNALRLGNQLGLANSLECVPSDARYIL